MLVQQDWQDANRKRSREDEYQDIAAGGTLGFTEHRSKRIQALPLRTSDTLKRCPAPPALPTGHHNFLGQPTPHAVTPSDSDSEDANAASYRNTEHFHQQHQSFQGTMVPHSPPTFYMEPELADGEDMDMAMDTPAAAPSLDQLQTLQGGHLQPGSLQPDSIGPPTITGRMPTPIQPSFAAQVRGGKNWSGTAGNIMATTPPHHVHGSAPGTHGDFGISQMGEPGFQRSLGGSMITGPGSTGMADWSMVQNRRLPSPISENGAEGEGSQSSSGMVMDSIAPNHGCHGPDYSLLPSLPLRASSAMEMGGSAPAVHVPPRVATPHVGMTGESSSCSAGGDGSMEVEAATPSPPRKGHSRSRHTVNSWTLQPGMKKSFSIGYRADCEKCRLKVPGHFNHIIIS